MCILVTMIMGFLSLPVNTSKEGQSLGSEPSVLVRQLHPPSLQSSRPDLWPSRGYRSATGEVTWKDIAINRWKNLLTINMGWKWSRLPSENENWPSSPTWARLVPGPVPADGGDSHRLLTSDTSLSVLRATPLRLQMPQIRVKRQAMSEGNHCWKTAQVWTV